MKHLTFSPSTVCKAVFTRRNNICDLVAASFRDFVFYYLYKYVVNYGQSICCVLCTHFAVFVQTVFVVLIDVENSKQSRIKA